MTGPGLTIAEAAPMLNPPMSERQLRDIVRALAIPPCGQRRTGGPGHPAALYDWAQIVQLHAALAPWLVIAKPDTTCDNKDHGHHPR